MQTAYLPLQNISSLSPDAVGGLCKFWFVPRQNIATFGVINPATQKLTNAPVLKTGCTWYGPVNVPDKKRGWKQTLEKGKPGLFYKQSVTGIVTGNSDISHINRQNLAYHEVVVVGLVRAGHFYIILGNHESALSYDEETNSGSDQFDTHESTFTFSGECGALVLTNFNP